MESVRSNGFVNYYGLQRFGSGHNATHLCAPSRLPHTGETGPSPFKIEIGAANQLGAGLHPQEGYRLPPAAAQSRLRR